MNEKKQKEIERKFINWIDTEDGGRIYNKVIREDLVGLLNILKEWTIKIIL